MGLKILMLWCASSSNSYIFDLKGLSMLHVEFSRIRTLRCSLVHNMFKRGCLWEQPLWKGRKEAELSEGRSQAVMQPKKLQLTPQEALDYTGGQSCPILGQSNKAFISCLNSHCMCLLWEGHDLGQGDSLQLRQSLKELAAGKCLPVTLSTA